MTNFSELKEVKMVESLEPYFDEWCREYIASQINSELKDLQTIYTQFAIHFTEELHKAQRELEPSEYHRFCFVFYLQFMNCMMRSVGTQSQAIMSRLNYMIVNRFNLEREIDQTYDCIVDSQQGYIITGVNTNKPQPEAVRSMVNIKERGI